MMVATAALLLPWTPTLCDRTHQGPLDGCCAPIYGRHSRKMGHPVYTNMFQGHTRALPEVHAMDCTKGASQRKPINAPGTKCTKAQGASLREAFSVSDIKCSSLLELIEHWKGAATSQRWCTLQ